MKINNNSSNRINFGMSFLHHAPECQKYLVSAFNNNISRYKKAMAVLDKKCDQHKYFDMFYSSHDDSIKIIGKSDLAGKMMAENYGSPILSVSKNEKYPNFYEKVKENLDELYKSPIGPQNFMERFFFRIYRGIYLHYAKIQVKQSPYESLPANVRKSVDIITELEQKI